MENFSGNALGFPVKGRNFAGKLISHLILRYPELAAPKLRQQFLPRFPGRRNFVSVNVEVQLANFFQVQQID